MFLIFKTFRKTKKNIKIVVIILLQFSKSHGLVDILIILFKLLKHIVNTASRSSKSTIPVETNLWLSHRSFDNRRICFTVVHYSKSYIFNPGNVAHINANVEKYTSLKLIVHSNYTSRATCFSNSAPINNSISKCHNKRHEPH